jgi:hypothetical protein
MMPGGGNVLSIVGRPRRTCEGLSRREVLQAGGAGLLGLSLPKVLAAEEAGAGRRGRAKSVIFLFLFGGPSQLETFDLKPEAPQHLRGPFRPIPSRTPGLLICEHLPRLANVSNRYCVLRTMTHSYNDHSGAAHYLQTGKRWQVPIGGGFNPTPLDWPSMGSIVEYFEQRRGDSGRDLPAYLVVPNPLGRLQENGQYRRPGEQAGWLGSGYNPLTTTVDKRDAADNPYWRSCSDEELTFNFDGLRTPSLIELDRIRSRVSLLGQLETQRRRIGDLQLYRQLDRLRQRALNLLASDRTRRALDLRQESEKVRERYGRHLFGQSALLARRLVEAGVRFVTVHYDCCDGYSWDSHVHSRDVKDHLLPTLDQALSALIEDLHARGLLDETLVVALGEMGRTPEPTPQWGRGHWSTLFPAVLAGAGVRGGSVVGVSDAEARYPLERPASPEDLAATIYDALGIDPDLRIPDPLGRPVPLVDGGRPIREVFG